MYSATRPDNVRATLKLSQWVPRLFAPATRLILGSGIYLSVVVARIGEPWGWIAVSFVTVIALAVWGKASGKRRNQHIAGLLSERGDTLTPALSEALHSPAPFAHAALDAWIVAGIVVLMVYQPSVQISIIVLAVALLAAYVTREWVSRRAKRKIAGEPLAV